MQSLKPKVRSYSLLISRFSFALLSSHPLTLHLSHICNFSLKPEKEKHHSSPFFLNSLCIPNYCIVFVLNSAIILYIPQSAVATVLNSTILFHVTHRSVSFVLNSTVALYIANSRVALILNGAITLYIPYRCIASVLNSPSAFI